jgi:hypothetical protein
MSTNTLEYSTPKCFYTGVIRHGGITKAVAAGIFLAGGIALAVLAHRAQNPMKLASLISVAALFAVTGIGFAWDWVANVEEIVRFTEEGIECGRRLWPWHRISEIGAIRCGDIIVSQFVTRPKGIWKCWRARSLPASPHLTSSQFSQLIDEIRTNIAARHPHVVFDREPKSSPIRGELF